MVSFPLHIFLLVFSFLVICLSYLHIRIVLFCPSYFINISPNLSFHFTVRICYHSGFGQQYQSAFWMGRTMLPKESC